MSQKFKIGILTMQVEGTVEHAFQETVQNAGRRFAERIEAQLPVDVELLTLTGQHFVPTSGAFAPLDFMEVAISEKVERNLSFLIVVTEVELASSSKSYLMAIASQATNIGLVTTKRLGSDDFGEDDAVNVEARLETLLFRTFGRLLNLPVSDDPHNIMSELSHAQKLDDMREITEQQTNNMISALPKEALDRSTTSGKWSFVVQTIWRQFGSILRIAWKAHPFHLLAKMPTMFATALSVIVVMLFGAETWDFAAAVSTSQLLLFVGVAFFASTFLLYRAFSLPTVTSRSGALSESVVVTASATLLALFLTLLAMFTFLALTMYFGAEFVFPDSLKKTWTTVEDARNFADHIKLSAFLAAVGVLSGSLGGAADNRALIRSVLFVSEDD